MHPPGVSLNPGEIFTIEIVTRLTAAEYHEAKLAASSSLSPIATQNANAES